MCIITYRLFHWWGVNGRHAFAEYTLLSVGPISTVGESVAKTLLHYSARRQH